MNKLASVTRPLMWFVALLLAALTAGCGGGGGGGGAILGAPNLVSLVSIAVTPAAPIIPVTGTQQFTAIATFSDGSTQNVTATSVWSSATLAVATIVPTTGLATGLTAGTSVITASYTASGVVKTATATLTVNAATSVSFKVTPTTATIPVGGTQQFAAIQTFSDGSVIDRTVTSAAGTASWTTSGGSAANATVAAATGLATGVAVTPAGTPVVVNASFTPAGVGAVPLVATPATLIVNAATSVSFVVKPVAASIRVGDIQQFSAIETFSDGTTSDRTLDPLTAWTSVDVVGAGVATLSANGATGGKATGNVVGSSTIHAVYTPAGGVAHAATPANLTVTAATLVSVNVTPVAASIVVGGTQQYTATALYSDGSSGDVTVNAGTVWASASPLVAAAPVKGVTTATTTGLTAGTANITAAFGGKTSPLAPAPGGAVLTVTAVNTGPAGTLPILGTASPYGILAWDAITINANSHIYGDVALPGGVIASVVGPNTKDGGAAPNLTASAVTNSAGVTPGQINTTDNGTLTLVQLGQLQTDLNAAYNDLMGRAPGPTALTTIASAANVSGGTFAAATDLSGYVLSPGIYTSPNTYALSTALGPLVLDAKGNPDAVFIIRSTFAGSGFTSTTGSVVLQGGAQAKNVFWVMLNNATIGNGASTFFQGTLVAGNVITLGTFTTVQGRMLAGALGAVSGAITLTGTNIITVPQ